MTGCYLLLLRLDGGRAVSIGSLGRIRFAKGNYVYVGSGMGGLEARVARHLRPEKRIKWHIDRLLQRAGIMGAVLFPSVRRDECSLARGVAGFGGSTVVEGFGSSDCRCPGHLFHMGEAPFGELLGHLENGGW